MLVYRHWDYASLLVTTGLSLFWCFVRGPLITAFSFALLMPMMSGVIYSIHWATAKAFIRRTKQQTPAVEKIEQGRLLKK
jgi:preprotein translocase subunit SecF